MHGCIETWVQRVMCGGASQHTVGMGVWQIRHILTAATFWRVQWGHDHGWCADLRHVVSVDYLGDVEGYHFEGLVLSTTGFLDSILEITLFLRILLDLFSPDLCISCTLLILPLYFVRSLSS